jgi:AICAR transformylase/IMP cyclohydrolase PurH
MPYFKRLKSKTFGFDLNGAVMASDAFPFPDCVAIAKGWYNVLFNQEDR